MFALHGHVNIMHACLYLNSKQSRLVIVGGAGSGPVLSTTGSAVPDSGKSSKEPLAS